MSTTPTRTPAKTNYLNNRDILKQIHLSKNTYCSFLDPVADHQYDIILPTVAKINQRIGPVQGRPAFPPFGEPVDHQVPGL